MRRQSHLAVGQVALLPKQSNEAAIEDQLNQAVFRLTVSLNIDHVAVLACSFVSQTVPDRLSSHVLWLSRPLGDNGLRPAQCPSPSAAIRHSTTRGGVPFSPAANGKRLTKQAGSFPDWKSAIIGKSQIGDTHSLFSVAC